MHHRGPRRFFYSLRFSWDTADLPDASRRDQVMVLAYDVEHQIAPFKVFGQFRESGSETLHVGSTKRHTYHIYAAFTAADRTKQSDSVYLGEMVF